MSIKHELPKHLVFLVGVLGEKLAEARLRLGNNIVVLAMEQPTGKYRIGAVTREGMSVYFTAWGPTDHAEVARLQDAAYGKPLGVIVPRDGDDLYLVDLPIGRLVS